MITQELKTKIDLFYKKLQQEHPVFSTSKDLPLTKEQIATYLENLRYLVTFTPEHLTLARDLAAQKNDEVLLRYYEMKLEEEVDHDKWGDDDLQKIKESFSIAPGTILPTLKDMISYCRSTIERDPALFLPYIFFTEYFTVIAGPAALANIETKSGITRDMMTIIGNHAELDREHTGENVEFFEEYLKNYPEYKDAFFEETEKTMKLYRAFSDQVVRPA